MLRGVVDEILFCDLRRPRDWVALCRQQNHVNIRFIQQSVLEVFPELPPISVFFYRRDGSGEGGSELYLLGEELFSRIIARCRPEGTLILTDGSNSSDGLFERLIQPEGFVSESWGWHFRLALEQPWLSDHGLYAIEAKRIS